MYSIFPASSGWNCVIDSDFSLFKHKNVVQKFPSKTTLTPSCTCWNVAFHFYSLHFVFQFSCDFSFDPVDYSESQTPHADVTMTEIFSFFWNWKRGLQLFRPYHTQETHGRDPRGLSGAAGGSQSPWGACNQSPRLLESLPPRTATPLIPGLRWTTWSWG